MKLTSIVIVLSFAACSGSQHVSTQDVCRDVAIGTAALDVLVGELATTMNPNDPAQNVFTAIDAIDEKVNQGAVQCARASRRMRASERLRRALAIRAALARGL